MQTGKEVSTLRFESDTFFFSFVLSAKDLSIPAFLLLTRCRYKEGRKNIVIPFLVLFQQSQSHNIEFFSTHHFKNTVLPFL